MKIDLLSLLVLVACGAYEPEDSGMAYWADPPIVNILDFLPSIRNVHVSYGEGTEYDIDDDAASIPIGHTVIVVKFDGKPCDIRVTNLPTATYASKNGTGTTSMPTGYCLK